ncbi:hypothetical protein ACFY4C_40295 [Actinomadura viridis]|uniref:hypothetical protein n=1 Tax=Actinomadura viridis TaxID=58110 RepID=UPI00369CC713
MARGLKISMILVAVSALVAGLTALVTARTAPARAGTSPAGTSPNEVTAPTGRTVIIGVPGLMWRDVGEHTTPTLWRLTGQGAGGALSVRTTKVNTCPTDGWLTLSAGQRARLPQGDCVLPAAPILPGSVPPPGSAAPPAEGATAPGWAEIKNDNGRGDYHARTGLLGDTVRGAGGCTTAVGPGAVFGLADGAGRVDRYVPSLDKVTPQDWTRCPLSAVDVDEVFRVYVDAGVDADGDQEPVTAAERAEAASAADRRIAQVVSAVPPGTNVLVAGLADIGVSPHLRLALAHTQGPAGGRYGSGMLTSPATRQPGMVTLTDLTATTLASLGLSQPKQAVGSPWRVQPTERTTAERVESLEDADVAAQAIRSVQGVFFWVLGGAQLLLYGLAALALRRRRWSEPGTRARILAGTRIVALVGSAAPVASILAGLLPWWQSTHPAPALICAVVGFAGLVAGVAVAGPWRRSVTAPGLVIVGVTALVLAVDVMTGSRLQLNALMGYTALVAGRFYGFGNQAFSLFAVATIMSAAWLAEYPLRAGRKGLAVGIVALVGVAAVAVDGLPAWGSDFGGVIAMVPAFAVLGLMVAGKRVSPVRLALFCLAGAALVLLISYLNARGANPTHMGRFWQDLVNGDAWETVTRKFQAMLRSLGYWPFIIPLAGAVGFLFFALVRPIKARTPLLERAYEHSVTMRPALLSALTMGVAGTLVNDSGVVILSVTFSLATPLMLAASVRALELDRGSADTSSPPRPGSPSPAPGRPPAGRS